MMKQCPSNLYVFPSSPIAALPLLKLSGSGHLNPHYPALAVPELA